MVCYECDCGAKLERMRDAAGDRIGATYGCLDCNGIFQEVDGAISGTPEGVTLKEIPGSFGDHLAQLNGSSG